MDLLEKNMESFRLYRAGLYEPLKSFQEESLKDASIGLEIESLTARDGNTILSITRDGKTFRLNSLYRPVAEAEKWCEQYEFKNLRINILMFGIGNGIFVKEMMKCVSIDTQVVLYEPSMPILFHIMREVDLAELIENPNVVFFFEGVNEKEFPNYVQYITHWSNLKTEIICEHPQYDTLFEESYIQFLNWIKMCNMTEVVNRNTEVEFAQSMVKNSLHCLRYVPDSNYISEFVGAFPEELPAIIVAAGPSLDKNIEELKRAEGKALIIATDTAVKHLVEHRVHFDCMVTVDPRKPALPPESKDVPLFCRLEARPRIMVDHQGKKIWIVDMGYLHRLYEKYNRLFLPVKTGGSVATTAFGIAVALKFKHIVLIGQDLAYQGEASHAGGIHSEIANEDESITEVEGIDGKPVKTRGDWVFFRDQFEKEISLLGDEVEVIDATEGGALIHGSKLMTLKDVIDNYCTKSVDITKIFQNIPPTFTGEEKERLKQDLLHVEKEVKSIRYKAKQATELAQKAISSIEEGKCVDDALIQRTLKELSKANRFIERQRVYDIIDQYTAGDVVEAMEEINVISGDDEADVKKSMEAAVKIYQTYIQAVEELRVVLIRTMACIRGEKMPI